MDLSPEEIALVSTVLDELLAAWVRFGRPAPAAAVRAQGLLLRALTSAVSQSRQSERAGLRELSEENTIGAREAAELLGCNRRTVQRRAEALGGQRIAGRFVFDRNDIEDMEDLGA
jgi:transcriptional regulator with GAF, ATPase, and Fis domain